MKTQILTTCGYRIAMLVSLLIGYPTYAVSNDNHLLFNASYLLQYKQQKGIIKISGTVKDAQDVLGGVIVSVGNKTVATDLDGKYTIDVSIGNRITFSMLGYKERSMVYSSSMGSILNIELLEDTTTLDEIVVNAGYYTVKDRERTGSIARVTAKDIEFQPVVNPLQALQGRMAGVSITQYSGTPGGGFDIQIRGRNSLRTPQNSTIDGNQPLYIVDGVPLSSDRISSNYISLEIMPMFSINPLSAIDPNNIESIEILKDADATAIYGSRGANGVVLITTKKGNTGKTNFSISSSTAFSKVASKMKLLNTEQFNKMRDEAFTNDGIKEFPTNAYDMNSAWDRNRYTDWQKELIGGTALSHNIQLSMNGGNAYTTFKISASRSEETTVFPNDYGYKRTSFLLNLNHRSKDNNLQINTSTNYSIQTSNLIASDLTKTALTLAPNAPALYNEDGSLNWQNGTFKNPLALMESVYANKNKNLILNANLSYQFYTDTYFKLNAGLTTTNFDESKTSPHTMYDPSLGYTSAKSSFMKGNNYADSYIIEPQLSWNKQFNKHSIDLLVGSTFQSINKNSFVISAENFTSNALITNITAAKNRTIYQSGNNTYKYLAFFGRINYKYDNRYILNFTGRRDGSSRFGKNNQFGNFGAIGGAWIFTNERFFDATSWLSFGKLRASYGTTGSDNIGDYQYLNTYTIVSEKYDDISSLNPSRLYNPDFGWEKTTKLETALELGLFNDRLNLTTAWYKNRSSNQLVGIPLPGTTGFSSVQANLDATVENTGWEFTLNTINIQKKDWKWTSNFTISFPKNKLISFPGLEGSTYANQFVIGESTNIKKVYQYLGIDPLTGLYQFTDYNLDGKFTASNDKQAIKDIDIKYHGGLQNTISYKNISLDFLFQFVKQDNYNYNKMLVLPGALINQPIEVLDRWDSNNPNASYSFYGTGQNAQAYALTKLIPESDKAIGDASYIRLKNIALTYSIPIPKARVESLKIYFQGQNLWTITNYFGLDPEFGVMGYLPPLKTYAFGIQLTF